MIRRISRCLTLTLLATLITPVLAPVLMDSSQARSGKTTICHRTNSIQNPYRRITVSNSSLNSGHKKHTGTVWTTSSVQGGTKWGDIIPDATAGGDNTNELNFAGDAAGQAIWRGTTINPRNGSAVCKVMTLKQFYDSEIAAGQTATQIVAELKDAEADEDLLLLQTLNLTFASLTTSNLNSVVTASQAIVVSTTAPTSVGVSTATLNGSVKTDGTALTCHFEYSTNSGFVPSTLNPSTATSVPTNATTAQTISLTGLGTTTKYYYRLVCHDTGGGDLYGETVSFTTGTTYTISYDSNTATSGTVPSDFTLYASSESASIRGNEGSLVKTGYSFAGWTLNADGSGTVYSPSNTTTLAMSQNRTLYAKWTATTFPVIFDSNTATSGIMSNQTYTAGSALAITTNGFSKTGFTFAGWATSSGGSVVYTNTQSLTLYETTTVYAKWTAGTYNVTFDSNTAISGTMSVQSFTAGTPFSLTTNGFTKTGYNFAGWATTSGGLVVYTNGQSITLNGATTLYAKWTATTFPVIFDSNTATSGSMSNQTYTAGSALALTANGFNKTGFTFAGWATSSGGSVVYSNTQSLTLYETTTVYAKWTAGTYAITFNINEGTSGTMSNQSLTAGTPLTLTTNAFGRTGYTFAGWATSSGGSVIYTDGQSVTLYGATTLYAKWTGITYTITYHINGATGGSAPANGSYTTGGPAYTVVGNTGSLTLSGYTFAGWNTQTDGNGATLTSYSTSADKTLYAVWNSNASYRVDYSGNGNTSGSAPTAQTVATGESLTVASNTGLFVRTGYTLLGWYSNSTGSGGTAYTPGVTSITPVANTTLYANWQATSFPVYFDSNTATSGSMSAQTFTAGTAQGLSGNTFSKTGYTFANWNKAADGTGTPYSNLASITIYETTTVYAQWTANSFPVIFDSNTATSGSMSNQTFIAGTSQGLSANTYAKTGFTFAGWATSSGGSVVYTGGQSITLYETATVYAKWTGNNLTVAFFNNGGSGTMSNQTIVAGSGTALSANTFTNSGYTFTGWNTIAGGSGTAYTNSEVVTITTDIDLYAQWSSAPTYSVTYTDGGGTGSVPTQSPLTSGSTFLTGSGSGLSRSGYTFIGWSCNSGSTIGVGVSVTMSAAAMTCVAQWTANSSGGGGSSSSNSRTPSSGNATSAAAATKVTPAVVKKTATLVTLATTPVKSTVVSTPVVVSTPSTGTATPGNSGSTPAATGTTPSTVITAPGNSGSTPSTGGTTTTAPGNSGSTPSTGGTATAPGNSGSTPSTGGTATAPGNSGSTPSTGGTTTAPGNSGSTPSTGGTTERINVNNTQLSQTTTITSTAAKSVTFTGVGITQATVVNNEVAVQAKPGFSGKTTVKITVTTEEEVSTITADVLVIPLPVTNPVVKVVSDAKSRIQWIRSPNAVTYEVTQNGKILCTTAGTICTVAQAVSADAPVQIKALGRDQTESTVKQATYVAAPTTPVIPEIALVVNFDTAKYNLDAGDKALIRAFAADVEKYGYTKIDISGHTDSRGGIDNNVLSNNRAKAARAYLLSLLPNLKVTINGYADAINVASNATAEGMSANRRAEFRVVG